MYEKHKPFVICYPPGSIEYKKKAYKIFDSYNPYEDFLQWISDQIGPDTIERIGEEAISIKSHNSFIKGKGMLVLLHNSEHISLGYRYLGLNKTLTQNFNFYQIKNPSSELLKNMGVPKIPRIVLLLPKKKETDLEEETVIDVITYENKFRYDIIKEFLEDMIKKRIKFLKDVPEFISNQQIESSCKESCLIFLVDRKKDEEEEEWEERMEIMKDSAREVNKIIDNFGFLDCRKHPEVLGSSKIRKDQLPTFLVYNSQNKNILKGKNKISVSRVKELLNESIINNPENYISVSIWINKNLEKTKNEENYHKDL